MNGAAGFEIDVRAIRRKLDLSHEDFAGLLGFTNINQMKDDIGSRAAHVRSAACAPT
jgi:hypothetical protein